MADEILARVIQLSTEGRHSEALSLLLPLVEEEVPAAIGLLGSMYSLGEGVDIDGPKAVELLKRAAALGDGPAAHNLATLLLGGMLGVPADRTLAREYYRLAKRLGAQFARDEFYE